MTAGNQQQRQAQFIDMRQIKKIEPKRNELTSTKGNQNKADFVKIDNLNAKTAEIMKNSPGFGNNLYQQNMQNQNFNPNATARRPLINVNINNSNKIAKDEMSNYEKQLFRQGMQGNTNTAMQMKNENVNQAIINNHNSYNNQKRNFYQMTDFARGGIVNSNNENFQNNFQTPLPNNYGIDQSDLLKTKKFKYN